MTFLTNAPIYIASPENSRRVVKISCQSEIFTSLFSNIKALNLRNILFLRFRFMCLYVDIYLYLHISKHEYIKYVYIHIYIHFKMIQIYCGKCYQTFYVMLNNQVIYFFSLSLSSSLQNVSEGKLKHW